MLKYNSLNIFQFLHFYFSLFLNFEYILADGKQKTSYITITNSPQPVADMLTFIMLTLFS